MSSLRVAFDVALGLLAVVVAALVRAVLRLRDRVLELELRSKRRDPPFE